MTRLILLWLTARHLTSRTKPDHNEHPTYSTNSTNPVYQRSKLTNRIPPFALDNMENLPRGIKRHTKPAQPAGPEIQPHPRSTTGSQPVTQPVTLRISSIPIAVTEQDLSRILEGLQHIAPSVPTSLPRLEQNSSGGVTFVRYLLPHRHQHLIPIPTRLLQSLSMKPSPS